MIFIKITITYQKEGLTHRVMMKEEEKDHYLEKKKAKE